MYVARFESAIEDFEAIIGIEPGNGAAQAARGLAREALGTQGGAGEGQAALPRRRADVRAEGVLSARCPHFRDVEDGR